MKRKAVFFDIDGTLWNGQGFIPESTKEAVRTLRKNGHLAFICTGRTRAFVQDAALLSIGFDGIVSGCGTMIEYGEETVFYHRIDQELAVRTVETVRRYGFRPILEGREYLYLNREDFAGDPYGEKIAADMGDHLLGIDAYWGEWEISKLSCATDPAKWEACYAELSDAYTSMVHNPYVAELVPKGFDKGTGLLKVCGILSVDPADTFAFGDSVNDLEMLAAAGTSVAMGNGSPRAKEAADCVTAPLMEDGIYLACRKFGLI